MSTEKGMITLKRIGYAAAAVSSAGASIYMLSNTLRKRKLDPWWAFDVHGAPPLAIQQQLDGIERWQVRRIGENPRE